MKVSSLHDRETASEDSVPEAFCAVELEAGEEEVCDFNTVSWTVWNQEGVRRFSAIL